MEFLQKKITTTLLRFRTNGALHVVYALSVEALTLGYLFFAGLFTVETLLPTFVTVRFSLTQFFFFLIIGTMLSALLGRFLRITLSSNINKKSPLLWLSIFWSISILLVSLIKFPPMIILILIALFLIAGLLFWHILFEEN